MSIKKKVTQSTKQNTKKFNPETDVVPFHPSGVGVAANEQDPEMMIIDFFSDNFRTPNSPQVILGSYAMSRKMAKDIVEMITRALEETKNKEEDNDSK